MSEWTKYKPTSFDYNGKWIKNWFSNMEPCEIIIDGQVYNSVENYYQAMKSPYPRIQKLIATTTPSKSKQMGRRIEMRTDWNDVKYSVMKKALHAKWGLLDYKEALIDTGNEIIIEWNNWGDRIWGVDIRDDKGQNLLGKALMEVRDELRRMQRIQAVGETDLTPEQKKEWQDYERKLLWGYEA